MLASGTRQLLYTSNTDALASLSLRGHFTSNCQLEASRREHNYLSNTPRFRKGRCFLVGSQPSLSSGNTNMLMKMRMEQRWTDTDRGETRSTRRKTCAQCHFAHHKSRTYRPGIEPRPPRSDAVDLSHGTTLRKSKINLNYTKRISSYLTENTTYLH
jgi:hypothetical protein